MSAVEKSDQRDCSDGFEIGCDNSPNQWRAVHDRGTEERWLDIDLNGERVRW